MSPSSRRLLVFVSLCTVFSLMVWMRLAGDSSPFLSLDHRQFNRESALGASGVLAFQETTVPRTAGPAANQQQKGPDPNASGKGHPVCQKWLADKKKAKASKKPPPPAPKCQVHISYGKGGIGAAQGQCVEREKRGDCDCSAKCPIELNKAETEKLRQAREAIEEQAGRTLESNEYEKLRDLVEASEHVKTPYAAQALQKEMSEYIDNVFKTDPGPDSPAGKVLKESGLDKAQFMPQDSASSRQALYDKYGPPSHLGGQQSAPSAEPSSEPSPSKQIEKIANTPPAGGQQGWNPSGQSTFNPSPILNNIANWGGIPSGGGNPPFGVSGSGYTPSSGNIAYVPIQQYGSLTSPNFDKPTTIDFPEARPSPEEILESLAQNTKRQSSEKVTEGELRGERVVDNVVMRALDNFFTPAGEFIRAFFAKEPTDEASNMDVGTKEPEDTEGKSPLERGRLVLTLVADDSLVPGDPSRIDVERSDRSYQAFESIPASNRAWVQGAPRAGEGIAGIASAPTYGWEDAPEDVEMPTAPDVADAPYDPLAAQGDSRSSLGVEDAEEQPKSFFSVMGKSFGTIGEAVNNLFKRITSTLFWWL